MKPTIKTWTQRRFERANVDLALPSGGKDAHTVADLYCLAPDPNTGILRRGPGWTLAQAFPSGFKLPAGAFYDQANQRFCFIGENASGDCVLIYTTSFTSWSGPHTLVSGKALGGLSGRNVAYWGGYLWIITDDGYLYRGTSYTSALSSFYSGGDAQLLAPMNDRMFAATSNGTVLRLTSTPGMGAYHDPVGDLNPVFLAAFHQYMTVVSQGDDDAIHIFRLPDYSAHGLHQLGTLPTPTYGGDEGCPFALYDDRIWLLTARQRQTASQYGIDAYAFNGSRIERAAYLDGQPAATDPDASGLLVWNNRLVYYRLDVSANNGHTFKVLAGDTFVDYAPLSGYGGAGLLTPVAWALGDYLVVTSAGGGDGQLHYANRSSLQDGYVVTSRLDMGYPGRKKRLEQITAILDGAAADFKTVVKYRVDDVGGWTTATTADNSRIARVAGLGVEFYLLQLRVELDDDTGNEEDIGLECVAVTYSAAE